VTLKIDGPANCAPAECEAILRSVPEWFGIEEALLEYVANTTTLPTFVIRDDTRALGFISLRQHFAHAWEIDCIAIHATMRNKGLGALLLAHVERWLVTQGARFLQVKTIAAENPNLYYAQTRAYYERMGFAALEVFPELWDSWNPCLQMLKILDQGNPRSLNVRSGYGHGYTGPDTGKTHRDSGCLLRSVMPRKIGMHARTFCRACKKVKKAWDRFDSATLDSEGNTAAAVGIARIALFFFVGKAPLVLDRSARQYSIGPIGQVVYSVPNDQTLPP
jgi:GNAT superfamily N-acetyltransferase